VDTQDVRRLVLVCAVVAAGSLVWTGSSAAWQYTFKDFFDTGNDSIFGAVAEAKKCTGGKLGTYKFRDFAQFASGDVELSLEITSRMSVQTSWGKMKHVETEARHSSDFPPDVVQGLADGFDDFFETVHTRYDPKHNELDVRHGSLVLFGQEVFGPEETVSKFKPKPGC
jgi:hypothetical protein